MVWYKVGLSFFLETFDFQPFLWCYFHDPVTLGKNILSLLGFDFSKKNSPYDVKNNSVAYICVCAQLCDSLQPHGQQPT